MSLIPHHTSDSVCALCELKLAQAHPDLAVWFRAIKAKYPDVHVSCAHRDQADQEQAFLDGKSKLHFPLSAHNKTPALALDLFQIDTAGKAVFDGKFMAQINDEMGEALLWGGTFRSLGDNDHFQVKE